MEIGIKISIVLKKYKELLDDFTEKYNDLGKDICHEVILEYLTKKQYLPNYKGLYFAGLKIESKFNPPKKSKKKKIIEYINNEDLDKDHNESNEDFDNNHDGSERHFYSIEKISLKNNYTNYYDIENIVLEEIIIKDIYEKLDSKQRKVFILILQDFNNKEISEATGFSRASVYLIKRKMKEIIRPYIK